MRSIILMLVFCSIVLLFFGNCDEHSASNPDVTENCVEFGDDVLLPASTGNYWQHKVWNGFDSTAFDTVTYSITDTFLLQYNNEIHSVFSARWSNDQSNIFWIYKNGSDGLYLMGGISGTDTLISPCLQFKYPVTAGESWQFPRMVYHPYAKFYFKDTITYSCVSDNNELITPADTFTTYVYKFKLSQGEDVQANEDYYFYCCPRVGIVGNEIYSDLPPFHKKREYKLIKYCLKE